jgi:hypothetical protein
MEKMNKLGGNPRRCRLIDGTNHSIYAIRHENHMKIHLHHCDVVCSDIFPLSKRHIGNMLKMVSFWVVMLGLIFMTGCAKKATRHDQLNPIAGASTYDLTDEQVASLTAESSTNAVAAYRLFHFYTVAHFNEEKQMAWLTKSAEGGYAEAQYSLAVMLSYLPGYVNPGESKTWLMKSAAQGYEPAKKMLLDEQK